MVVGSSVSVRSALVVAVATVAVFAAQAMRAQNALA